MALYVYPSNVETEISNAYIGIPYPESISLDKSSISLTTIWQTVQLTATLTPSVCDDTITWTSSDDTIATVSSSWLVTCVTPWECTITATTVNSLTATCTVAQSRLPSTYQEVEYIGSSWTQYIKLWYVPTVNTSIVTDISWSNQVRDWAVFRWVTSNDSSSDWVLWRLYGSTYTNFNPRFCNSSYAEAQVTCSLDTFHNIVLASNTLEVDGTSYTITTSWTPYQSWMDLFAWNNGGTHWWRTWVCKFKTFKIYESWVIAIDLVPCYRISDSVIWLYDLVNWVFYTNSGSWTFTKWSDV